MSAHKHKKTSNPLERLDDETREAMRLQWLSLTVGEACTRFFKSRGMRTGRVTPWGERADVAVVSGGVPSPADGTPRGPRNLLGP